MNNQKAEDIMEFLRSYIRTENMAPTVREICLGVGIRSTSTVHDYLHELERQGRIRMLEGKKRTIFLTETEEEDIPGIPLAGTVAAGIPITAVENISEYIRFQPSKSYSNPLFALRVRGDSMINRGILDGDIVIVEQTPYAENGDVVVALVDGCEATVKTFYKENGHYRLQPENDEMEPIIVNEVEILGRVVNLIRDFGHHFRY